MTMRNEKGEVVTLALMGIMMVGGLLFWMFSGHSHMSGMHGGRHPIIGCEAATSDGSVERMITGWRGERCGSAKES